MLPRVPGFIGLGVMGYPMAVNLLKKVDAVTKLQVNDVSGQVVDRFKDEAPDLLSVSSSARESADRVVRSRNTSATRINVANWCPRTFCS